MTTKVGVLLCLLLHKTRVYCELLSYEGTIEPSYAAASCPPRHETPPACRGSQSDSLTSAVFGLQLGHCSKGG